MNENTRNAFASYGLEILKRSVLLVLYEKTQDGGLIEQVEISNSLDIPYVQNPSGNTHSLIQGILDQLKLDRHAHHEVGCGWQITEQGVSLIEV